MIWVARAEVVALMDGDTFHSNLNIGWGVILMPRRMPEPGLGTVRAVFPDGSPYDCPEDETPHGAEAAAYTRTLIAVGDELPVQSFRLDDFGRTLGAVTRRDGRDWATTMAQAGFLKCTCKSITSVNRRCPIHGTGRRVAP